MKREVTLIHSMGGKKEGLTGELFKEGAGNKTSKVFVNWPLHGELCFSAVTGLESGKPRGQWKLSPEDVAAFCEAIGLRPAARALKPLKPRKKKQAPIDPRQTSFLVGNR